MVWECSLPYHSGDVAVSTVWCICIHSLYIHMHGCHTHIRRQRRRWYGSVLCVVSCQGHCLLCRVIGLCLSSIFHRSRVYSVHVCICIYSDMALSSLSPDMAVSFISHVLIVYMYACVYTVVRQCLWCRLTAVSFISHVLILYMYACI